MSSVPLPVNDQNKTYLPQSPERAELKSRLKSMARGAFEYQGQKCSAASRVYVPQSRWGDVCDRVVAMLREMDLKCVV
jgi:1-pyrroline-5-carboxylate dehydrogenase